MKRLSLIAILAMFTFVAKAQELKFASVDTSPADIVYFPLNAAKAKDNSAPSIKMVYSRPTKKGREIFGVLEQFGKVWRVGANESAEIKFYKRVKIGGKSIKAGSYSLFAIPNQDKWTMIINRQTDRWGAFTYDQTKDVVRVDVPVKVLDKPMESFAITFTTEPQGADLVMAWDRTLVELPITIK
ncbi:DUF2911 domain-containing protein [Pedobacter hiemivivus]|uniref:DUF2911 domain-containing protein n=1 Tax=Pedobacter hiemivivus TaxID=2530454 RepID=A0A4U1G355_9SPHI|nr:DUF2911 domain-containing protein [Pedobacter hiemivivus]TCC86299.1 DUF2911 domain-containing protein [Pedobacter hiemivivus]TKC58027.1 DUF2911 domain-containing protein [Pedobacter hiemivivus]